MSQAQEQQQQVNFSINELIFAQVKDLGKGMDRLEKIDASASLKPNEIIATVNVFIAEISAGVMLFAVIYAVLK